MEENKPTNESEIQPEEVHKDAELPAEDPKTTGDEEIVTKQSEANEQEVAKTLEDDAEGKNSGPKPSIAKFATGVPGVLPMTGGRALRSALDPDDDDYRPTVDFDSRDVTDAAKEREYASIECTFVDEGTAVTNEAPSKEYGKYGPEAIYPIDTRVATETKIGLHSRAANNDVRSRENGKIYISEIGKTFDVSDAYTRKAVNNAGATNEEVVPGQDSALGFEKKSLVLFNRLTPTGTRLKSEYQAVEVGRFLVKGINLFPKSSETQDLVIGYVDRKDADGDVTKRIPVYKRGESLFNVIELTSTIADISSAAVDMAQILVANKSKFRINQYQALSDAVKSAEKVGIDQLTDIKEYPDFSYKSERSTLFYASPEDFSIRKDGADVDASCYNDYAKLIQAMNQIRQSELMFVPFLDNAKDFRKNLVYHRTVKGKGQFSPYFEQLGLKTTGSYAMPNLKHFAEKLASTNAWDTEPKFRNFNLFWKKVGEEIKTIEDTVVYTQLMAKWSVVDKSVNDVIQAFEYGRITSDNKTSHELVKETEEVNIILGYNPNDLIGLDYDNPITIYNAGEIKDYTTKKMNKDPITAPRMYPICGYAVIAREKNMRPNAKIYNICPRWLAMMMKALSSVHFQQEVLWVTKNYSTTAYSAINYFYDVTESSNKTVYTRNDTAKYLPYTWHHTGMTWLDYVIIKMMAHATTREIMDDSQLPDSGLDRFDKWMALVDTDHLLNVDTIKLSDLLAKIQTNDVLYHDPKKTDPANMTEVHDPHFMEDNFKAPIATLSYIKTVGTGNNVRTMVLFDALRWNRNLADFSGFESFKYDGSLLGDPTTDADDSLEHVLYDCLSATPTKFKLIKIGEGVFVLGNAAGNIYTFRKKISKDTIVRANILTENADPSILGYTDPATEMFDRDNHEWVPEYDCYVCIVNKGLKLKAHNEESSAATELFDGFDYTFKMCGALILAGSIQTAGDNTSNMLELNQAATDANRTLAFYKTAPRFFIGDSCDYGNKNKLYAGEESDDVVTTIPRNLCNLDVASLGVRKEYWEYAGTRYTREADATAAAGTNVSDIRHIVEYESAIMTTNIAESRFVGMAAIPSLYSGKVGKVSRLVAYYVDNNQNYQNGFGTRAVNYSDWAGHSLDPYEVDEGRIITISSNAANIKGFADGMKVYGDFTVEAYLQPTVFDHEEYKNYYLKAAAMANELAFKEAMNGAMVVAADKSFFVQSLYYTSNMHCPRTAYRGAYASFEDILRHAKMWVSNEVAGQFDAYVLNSDASSDSNESSYKIIKSFYTSVPVAELLEEFNLKHGINKRLNLFPARCTVRGRVDTFGSDKHAAVTRNEFATHEPRILRSRMYTNDYRDWNIGNAVINLNTDWQFGRKLSSEFANMYEKK